MEEIQKHGVDALVVIGGDGSFRGAEALGKMGLPVVGIPGTIDNDIAGTDVTIGYDTAVNTALSAVQKLRDTASSHDRLFIVEVMGRDAGFLALEVAVSTGAGICGVPEIRLDIAKNVRTAPLFPETGQDPFAHNPGGGVMSALELKDQLQDTGGYDARVTVLGYIQRGGSPTSFDTILASRMIFAVRLFWRGSPGNGVGGLRMRPDDTPAPWRTPGSRRRASIPRCWLLWRSWDITWTFFSRIGQIIASDRGKKDGSTLFLPEYLSEPWRSWKSRGGR